VCQHNRKIEAYFPTNRFKYLITKEIKMSCPKMAGGTTKPAETGKTVAISACYAEQRR